jgi:hypothetical protein
MGQPAAMPAINVPVWQKGTPQSMHRAPCLRRASSGMWSWNSFQWRRRSWGSASFGSSRPKRMNPVGLGTPRGLGRWPGPSPDVFFLVVSFVVMKSSPVRAPSRRDNRWIATTKTADHFLHVNAEGPEAQGPLVGRVAAGARAVEHQHFARRQAVKGRPVDLPVRQVVGPGDVPLGVGLRGARVHHDETVHPRRQVGVNVRRVRFERQPLGEGLDRLAAGQRLVFQDEGRRGLGHVNCRRHARGPGRFLRTPP